MVGFLENPGSHVVELFEASRFSYGETLRVSRFSYGLTLNSPRISYGVTPRGYPVFLWLNS